jgi:hypothetical protein
LAGPSQDGPRNVTSAPTALRSNETRTDAVDE